MNLGKNLETIQADIRSPGVALTVNGTPLAAVGPDLRWEATPLQFGFIIEQDQVVRLSGIRISAQSTSSN